MTLPLSKHIAEVSIVNVDDSVQEVTSIDVRIEETWSPYIQATITVPKGFTTYYLDPRSGNRVRLFLQQEFGGMVHPRDLSGSVATLTATYIPRKPRTVTEAIVTAWNIYGTINPISYLTAGIGGLVSSYTAAFTYVYDVTKYLAGSGSLNPPPATVFDADLAIRSMTYNELEEIYTVSLSSDEALLQDYAWVSATPYTPATTDVATLVNYVLGKIGATLASGSTTATYDNTVVKWLPGQSGWDFINPIVQASDLVLYCDEGRNWRLVEATATSGSLALEDTSNIIELTSSVDLVRDYFDSCVVTYSWYNGTAQQVEYDIYAPIGSVKTRNVQINGTPYPGAGLAYSLTQRALTRSEMFELNAVSNYDARPRQELTVSVTDQPTKTAVISSINWRLPADTMNISIRNLVEV